MQIDDSDAVIEKWKRSVLVIALTGSIRHRFNLARKMRIKSL